LVTDGGPKISEEERTMERMETQELPWWIMPAGVAALVWGIVALVIDCHADAWLGR
jgi:hypothetical protein